MTHPRFAPRLAAGLALLGLWLGSGLPLLHAGDAPSARDAADGALRRGVAFLAKQQNPNGSWGVIPGAPEPGELGVSALIVRAIAKAPAALRDEAAAAALARGVGYLTANQQPDGSFSPPGTGLATYRTALALTALKAVDATAHADAIARARGYLEKTQFSEQNGLEEEGTKSPYYGGWGYDHSGQNPDADLSNTQFALEALREAGLSEQSEVWKRAVVFLQRCQNRTESNDVATEKVVILDDGGFMYDPALDEGKSVPQQRPDGKVEIPSYASMTYAGLMSLLYAHVGRDDPRVKAALGWIQRHYTLEENYGLGTRQEPQKALQGLYYYYQAFARALAAWGRPVLEDATGAPHRWADDLARHLAAVQKPEGFWVNTEPRWWEQDPVLCTGYSVLALGYAYPFLAEEPDGRD